MDRHNTPEFATPKGQTRTRNPAILSDGSVDPKSSMYLRGVAGRQKLDDYVKDLWAQGKSEKDVFMAAVKSLQRRGHGYVGAYLDSKNPGRVYDEKQAMKIADEVMSKAGVGSHPGARLTPTPKGEERDKEREDRKGRKDSYQPGPAPKKAQSVRQQRKEGPRENLGMPESWPREGAVAPSSPVKKPEKQPTPPKGETGGEGFDLKSLLDQRMRGEITTQELVDAYNKAKEPPASAAKKPGGRPKKPAAEGGAPTPTPSAAPEETPAPQEKDETPLIPIEGNIRRDLATEFQTGYKTFRDSLIKRAQAQSKGVWDKSKEKYIQPSEEDLRDLVDLSIDNLADRYGNIDRAAAKAQLRSVLTDQLGIDPYEGEQEEAQAQPEPAPKEVPAEPAPAKPEEKSAPPSQQEETPSPSSPRLAKANEFKGKVLADIDLSKLNEQDKKDLEDYRKYLQVLRDPSDDPEEVDYVLEQYSKGYETAIDLGLPRNPKEEDRILQSRSPRKKPSPSPLTSDLQAAARGGRKSPGGGGFAGSFVQTAKDKIKEKADQGMSKEEFMNSMMKDVRQGTLFPGGLATDTPETNPLEGGSTPQKAQPVEERAPSSPEGQGTLFRKDGSPRKWRQPAAPKQKTPSQPQSPKQLDLPLGKADSRTRVAQRASEIRGSKEESQRAKTEKAAKSAASRRARVGSPKQGELLTPGGKPRKFSSSESMRGLSYDEFSRAIKGLMY